MTASSPQLAPQGINDKPLKAELDVFHSYLATIKNSIGTNMFRSRYYIINGQPLDVIDDGDLACALYISSILRLFDLIPEVHTTIAETVRHMHEAGWQELSEPRSGAVIIWDVKKHDNGTQGSHRHIGFYIDPETAISNSPDSKTISQHHPTFGALATGEPRRDILKYYWHTRLDT